MTFYNVIAGILFIEAFKVFAVAAFAGDGSLALPAGTLLTVIVNDIILTTEALEYDYRDHRVYDIWLKYIDFVCFGLFSLALLCLNDGAFGIVWGKSSSDEVLPHVPPQPWLFWSLITGYWCLMVVWNWSAWGRIFRHEKQQAPTMRERYERVLGRGKYMAYWLYYGWLMPIIFAVASILCWCSGVRGFHDVPWAANVVLLALAVFYPLSREFRGIEEPPAVEKGGDASSSGRSAAA